MKHRTLAVVSAGLSQPSSTRLLADQLSAAAVAAATTEGVQLEVKVIELRDLAHDIANHLLTGFPPAAATSEAWVGASGTWAGLRAANSLRSTGTTSSPSRSSCSSTVFRGKPAWSSRKSWRW